MLKEIAMKIYLVILLAAPLVVYAQYDLVDQEALDNPCGTYRHQTKLVNALIDTPFCRVDWELDISEAVKRKLLTTIVDVIDSINRPNSPTQRRIAPHNAYFVDFNSDGLPDIMRQYWLPEDKTLYLELWVNVDSTLQNMVILEGEILEAQLVPEKNDFIFLLYHEECCSETHHIKKYTIRQGSRAIELNERLSFQGVLVENPDGKIGEGVAIRLNEKRTLYAKKSSGPPDYPVAMVKAGTRAVVVSDYVDRAGSKWYCIKLEPGTELIGSRYERDIHLNPDLSNFPVSYFGWIRGIEPYMK